MKDCLRQEKIRKIASPNGEFICLFEYEDSHFQGFDPKITLYKVVNKDMVYKKTLFGDGIFLNEILLLLFVNPSGYGPFEGDCYLYDISCDKLTPLYDENLDVLLERANNNSWGEFISLESNLLVTQNLLILKTLFSGIFFYDKHEIISSKKLKLLYSMPLPSDDIKTVDELLGYQEQTNLLKFVSDGTIKKKVVEFNRDHFTDRETSDQREEILEMMNEQVRIEIEEYENHLKQLNTPIIHLTMQQFIISANEFLKNNTQAYYRYDYTTFGTEGNPDFINHLKNQFGDTNPSTLQNAVNELIKVLQEDLPKIKSLHNTNLTVCVIPRAKAESHYSDNQKLFKRVISSVVDKLSGFTNGTSYMIRNINTRTTHMNRSGYGGDGDMPYVGITKATCKISSDVRGKDMLLIDDIYTKGVNIDEDAIQALLDNGAKSVIFYAVAKTYKGGIKQIVRTQVNNDNDDDLPF